MPAGRPLKYKTAKAMQKVIDKYFKDCEGKILTDKQGNTVYDKYGQPVWINVKPPTVTGLALALGFNSRQSLLNYEAKDADFLDTLTCAKARVEAYAESRLFDKDGANGAKFSLANNFKNWAEKQEVSAVNTNTNVNIDTDITDKFAAKATAEEIEKAAAGTLSWVEIVSIAGRE